ncbi:hypothetical protein DRE_05957 [Drechslerella stenobrocha 248]|uniref:THUMP domain-containing protein n=1 Tax=Drechslerella stenobrocha 248 TaxID=1043628 RepID=W7I8A1_9PEZI|nr:hypothetical protein DRE_05957 [Drechslerella stenobrocha 248]
MTHPKKRKERDDAGKGQRNKRSKHFYMNANKHIEPDWNGIFATCDMGRESRCVAELYRLFEEYADKIYGPEDAGPADGAQDQTRNEAEDDPGDDIETAIAAEVQSINAKRQNKAKRITSIRLDTQCLIFFHTRAPVDPTELVASIFKDMEETRERKTRFTNRLTPITKTCKANYEDLEKMAKEVLEPHFHKGQTGVKFAIRPNLRDHNVMNRDEIIKTVARTVGSEHKVDLKHYELLIIVEVHRNICGVSVVRDFEHYKRFNMAKVLDESEPATGEKACGVAPE